MEPNAPKRRKLGPEPAAASSSAFVDATDELLQDVKLDFAKSFAGVDTTLHQFKDAIESLEAHEPYAVGDAFFKNFEKTTGTKIPYPHPQPDKSSNYKLSFAPGQVNVVGSYQLRTMIRSQAEVGIDMIVVMPSTLFQEKDFRDFRYFYKRSYYLARISALGIQKSLGSSMDLSFEYLHGNDLLPILVVRPKEATTKSKYAIRIIPCAPDGLFPASKLLPTSNTIRHGVDVESPGSFPATPFYNATLRAESQFNAYLRLLNSTAKACAGFKDACILGRVWLRQRGFGSGDTSDGGFGHFEWAVLVALLLQGGGLKGEAKLSPQLSSSQLFSGTLQFLAETNLQNRKKPLIFGPRPADLAAVRQAGPFVYDSTRELNVLWKMTPWSAAFLQRQAKQSVAGLRDASFDHFDSLFIVKVDQPLHNFDLLVKVNLPDETSFSNPSNHRGLAWDFGEKTYQVLNKALDDRSQLVHIILPKTGKHSISVRPKYAPSSIMVGIILEPKHASRKMDHGPSVEEKEAAAKYREFWGEKAELRRFQDGSILECLEWDPSSSSSIAEQIIGFIAKTQLGLDDDDLTFYGDNFSQIAKIDHSDALSFSAARKALEILEHDIRELDDLPLHIRQVAGTSPALRSASVHPPALMKKPAQPMDVVVSFEASGKWADNLAAIQRLKIAFLHKIGSSLESANDEIKTHIGLDAGAERDTQNLAFLDVVYERGFAFRLRVQSDAEDGELEKRARDRTADRRAQAEAADLLALSRRRFALLPLHNQVVATWCTRFPPLSSSIRLVKHWFSCHKLYSHFPQELLELFVLQAFLNPYPWQTPTSAPTGFLRTIHMLSRWDWQEEPMIIDTADPSTPMPASDRTAISARFSECRRLDPRFNRTALFVATPFDHSGTAFTREGPSRVVANQMSKLASTACELIKAKGVDLDPRSLFQSSLRHYDFVLHLDAKVVKALLRDEGAKYSYFKNLDAQPGKAALPLAEHPVEAFLRQLNSVYSAALVLFHGSEDDRVVAGLWNRDVRHTRTSRVNMPSSFRPVKGQEAALELDEVGILAEIARIGGDLVQSIERRNAD